MTLERTIHARHKQHAPTRTHTQNEKQLIICHIDRFYYHQYLHSRTDSTQTPITIYNEHGYISDVIVEVLYWSSTAHLSLPSVPHLRIFSSFLKGFFL